MIDISKFATLLSDFNPSAQIKRDLMILTWKLYDANEPLQNDCLYVVHASIMGEFPQEMVFGTFLIIRDDDVPEIFLENEHTNLIFLPGNTNFVQLLNFLQKIFSDEKYLLVSMNKLIKSLSETTSLDEIIEICYEIFGNPVLLLDSSLCILGFYAGGNVPEEPFWQHCIFNGFVPIDYVLKYGFEDSDLIQSSAGGNKIARWESGVTNFPQMICQIVSDQGRLAFLHLLEYNKPFRDIDEYLLKIASNVLSVKIRQFLMPDAPQNTQEFLLYKMILNDGKIDEYTRKSIMLSLNLRGIKAFHLICFECIEQYEGESEGIRRYRKLLSNFLQHPLVIVDGRLVALVAKERAEDPFVMRKSELVNILKDSGLVVGVSRCFNDIANLRPYYLQATEALKAGKRIDIEKRAFEYDQFSTYALLSAVEKDTDLMAFCHPSLNVLMEYDREKGVNLSENLYYFLKYDRDISKTAQALFVHYNTMRYRIRKIESVMGIYISDPDNAFKIKLSICIFEFVNKTNFLNLCEKSGDSESEFYHLDI